jgi:hypothetical protein
VKCAYRIVICEILIRFPLLQGLWQMSEVQRVEPGFRKALCWLEDSLKQTRKKRGTSSEGRCWNSRLACRMLKCLQSFLISWALLVTDIWMHAVGSFNTHIGTETDAWGSLSKGHSIMKPVHGTIWRAQIDACVHTPLSIKTLRVSSSCKSWIYVCLLYFRRN